MRLKKGISGFDAEHLIEQDMRMFQLMVYHLATSEKQAKVWEFIDQPHFVYLQAVVEIDGEMLTILHHRFMPYIAFAKRDEELSFTFLFFPRPDYTNIFICANAWKRLLSIHYFRRIKHCIIYPLTNGNTSLILIAKLLETLCLMLGINALRHIRKK